MRSHSEAPRSRRPTFKPEISFTLLLVGCPPPIDAACADAAALAGVRVMRCDLTTFRATATRWRPAVIVLTALLSAFAPPAFADIAAALGAAVVKIADDGGQAAVDEALVPAIFDAMRRWELAPVK